MSDRDLDVYWTVAAESLCDALHTSPEGLSHAEAARRLTEHGPNQLSDGEGLAPLKLLLSQFTNPLVVILLFAALLSAYLHEWLDAAIVIVIVIGSGGLGFIQEYRASVALVRLHRQVASRVLVLR